MLERVGRDAPLQVIGLLPLLVQVLLHLVRMIEKIGQAGVVSAKRSAGKRRAISSAVAPCR